MAEMQPTEGLGSLLAKSRHNCDCDGPSQKLNRSPTIAASAAELTGIIAIYTSQHQMKWFLLRSCYFFKEFLGHSWTNKGQLFTCANLICPWRLDCEAPDRFYLECTYPSLFCLLKVLWRHLPGTWRSCARSNAADCRDPFLVQKQHSWWFSAPRELPNQWRRHTCGSLWQALIIMNTKAVTTRS